MALLSVEEHGVGRWKPNASPPFIKPSPRLFINNTANDMQKNNIESKTYVQYEHEDHQKYICVCVCVDNTDCRQREEEAI